MATGPESFEEFSKEELQNLKQLAQDVDEAADELNSTRREVIKSLGLLGTGIAAGGISAQQLIEQVSAQASTTDGDGNVGLPSDRVDGYFDGIDGNSASLGSLNTENADAAVINKAVNAEEYRKKNGFDDIGNAVNDAFNNGVDEFRGGIVYLPPKNYTINNQIVVPHNAAAGGGAAQNSGYALIGHGMTSTILEVGPSFSDAEVIRLDSDTSTGSSHGHVIGNFRLNDLDSNLTASDVGLQINSLKRGRIKNVFFDLRQSERQFQTTTASGADTLGCEFINLYTRTETAGPSFDLDTSGSPNYLRNVFSRADAASGTGILLDGFHFLGDFGVEKADVGLRITGDGSDLKGRIEGGSNVNTPVQFDGNHNRVRLNDLGQAAVLNSEFNGTGNTVVEPEINTSHSVPATDGATVTSQRTKSPVTTDIGQAHTAVKEQITTGVGTSATDILQADRSAFVVVNGYEEGSSGNEFIDVVSFIAYSSASETVISTNTEGAASRSYGVNNDKLQVSFGSGTHVVVARGMELSGRQ